MSDESKIRDAADAVRGVVEAVPVYEDALQPAARELGRSLEVVAKTVGVALAPLKIMVWGWERIEQFYSTTVANKLRHVPESRIRTPEPHVVVPVLQALVYTGEQAELRELYANLLATSLDSATCRDAHPAFVEIIKNMSPDEAKIVRLIAKEEELPFLEVQVAVGPGLEAGYRSAHRSFSFIGQQAGCDYPELTPGYLDNLERLGLLEVPPRGMMARHLADAELYKSLEEAPEIGRLRKEAETKDQSVHLTKSYCGLTNLGSQFVQACVLEKVDKA